jgi:hypothetical protein
MPPFNFFVWIIESISVIIKQYSYHASRTTMGYYCKALIYLVVRRDIGFFKSLSYKPGVIKYKPGVILTFRSLRGSL